MIDFELTDEQKLIRETARDFSDREIAPRARENDRNEHFDTELVKQMADMGFLGAIVPEQYGGRDVDYLTYGLIVEEIGRNDSAMRTVVSVVTSLVCSSLVRWGSEEQKQQWLPELCSGEGLGCFGLTEPDTGSDASNLKTRAEKIDGGWRLSGGKMWISLGNYSKLALIFAQTDPSKKHKGLACFLVPTEADGFSSQEIHGKLGLKGSDTAELSLDGVEVGDDALMGEIGDGFKIAMSALDSGRYSVAAGCVGICQASLDASVAYSFAIDVSVVFGLPWSFSQPARHTSPRAASVCTTMSASISCTSWNDAIGRSNWVRSFEYATDASSDAWQIPTHPAATL